MYGVAHDTTEFWVERTTTIRYHAMHDILGREKVANQQHDNLERGREGEEGEERLAGRGTLPLQRDS